MCTELFFQPLRYDIENDIVWSIYISSLMALFFHLLSLICIIILAMALFVCSIALSFHQCSFLIAVLVMWHGGWFVLVIEHDGGFVLEIGFWLYNLTVWYINCWMYILSLCENEQCVSKIHISRLMGSVLKHGNVFHTLFNSSTCIFCNCICVTVVGIIIWTASTW